MFREKLHILVLGSTGAGKTNFLRSLEKELPVVIDRLNRTEYAVKEQVRIDGQPFIFVDTPGELAKKDDRIRAIRQAMAGGIAGVINVVSYGFHEHRTGDKNEALTADYKPNAGWLDTHRKLEINMLSEWTELLGSRETASWMMTVVTKADLWWNERREVRSYYEKGAYAEALGSAHALHPIVIEHCSIIKRFYGDGRVADTFDDIQREELRQNLVGALLGAVARG